MSQTEAKKEYVSLDCAYVLSAEVVDGKVVRVLAQIEEIELSDFVRKCEPCPSEEAILAVVEALYSKKLPKVELDQ